MSRRVDLCRYFFSGFLFVCLFVLVYSSETAAKEESTSTKTVNAAVAIVEGKPKEQGAITPVPLEQNQQNTTLSETVLGHESLKAWDGLYWGMNPATASAVLQRMVRRADVLGLYTHQIDGTYKGYSLMFTFLNNNSLERVALFDNNPKGQPERMQRLRELLTLKYGFPEKDVERNIQTFSWLDEHKLVSLAYRTDKPAVQLVYVWRRAAMTERY